MNRLEMRALSTALEQWGQPVVTGMAGAGEIDVLVVGTVVDYCLVIAEPVLLVRDCALVSA